MLSLSFSAFQAWSFSFLVGVRFFCLAAMIRRNPSITSLSDTLTLCLSSCLRISSFASLWGSTDKNFMSTADHGSEFMYSTVYIMVNIIAVALYPHRSSSCLRALLWALRALSSACLFCSSASTSSSESPPGPGRSSESSSPWATSSSLIRASRERVWGTLEGEKKVIRYVVQNVPISQLIYHTVRCVSATGVWRWLPRCQENWSLCLSPISRHR